MEKKKRGGFRIGSGRHKRPETKLYQVKINKVLIELVVKYYPIKDINNKIRTLFKNLESGKFDVYQEFERQPPTALYQLKMEIELIDNVRDICSTAEINNRIRMIFWEMLAEKFSEIGKGVGNEH